MIKIIGMILALIFSIVTTYSFISSKKCTNGILSIEIAGQAFIVAAVIIDLMKVKWLFISLMCTGLLLIIISCILNGLKMYGHVHISHHIVRIVLCMVIVILCVLGGGK